MRIKEVKLSPKHPRLEAINVTNVTSLEFAEFIRKCEEDESFEKIEGRFVMYKEGARSIKMNIEF